MDDLATFRYGARTYAVRARSRNYPVLDGTPEFYIEQVDGPPPSRAIPWFSIFTPTEEIRRITNEMRVAEGLPPR